jgi:threonine/homoserine/homoserine lactone efflux protein
MTAGTWAFFVLVSILPALSPGPAILLAVSNSIRFGFWAVAWSALANAAGLTILGLAVSFGLSALMAASTLAFAALKIAGAIYLTYLGIKLWRGGSELDFAAASSAPPKSRGTLFFEALLLALTNPKGLVLLAALLPPFINRDLPVLPQAAVLSLTFAALCFCNHLFLAATASRARRFLASARRMAALRRALGALFVGFGAALAFSARP